MKAVDTFHKEPYRHNCAQAVGYKWIKDYDNAEFAAYGGGRAPDGTCGALYAAMLAAPEHAEEIRREFAERCGATRCREIKSLAHTPCPLCVDIADQLLTHHLPSDPT